MTETVKNSSRRKLGAILLILILFIPILINYTTLSYEVQTEPVHYSMTEDDPDIQSKIVSSDMVEGNLVILYLSDVLPHLHGIESDVYKVSGNKVIVFGYDGERFDLVFGEGSDVYAFGEAESSGGMSYTALAPRKTIMDPSIGSHVVFDGTNYIYVTSYGNYTWLQPNNILRYISVNGTESIEKSVFVLQYLSGSSWLPLIDFEGQRITHATDTFYQVDYDVLYKYHGKKYDVGNVTLSFDATGIPKTSVDFVQTSNWTDYGLTDFRWIWDVVPYSDNIYWVNQTSKKNLELPSNTLIELSNDTRICYLDNSSSYDFVDQRWIELGISGGDFTTQLFAGKDPYWNSIGIVTIFPVNQAEIDPSITWTEAFGSFTPTTSSAWTNYDAYTNKGIPKGAVMEVICAHEDDDTAVTLGVRTDESALDTRFLNLHEAEGGGFVTVNMLVTVDSSTGLIEYYCSQTTEVTYYIMGYWTDVTFTETFIDITIGTSEEWYDVNAFSSYSIPKGSTLQIACRNKNLAAFYNVGVRTDGSALNRIVSLAEAEGEAGGVNIYTTFVKTSVADGIFEYWCEVTEFYLDLLILGYFDSSMDYQELWSTSVVSSDSTWEQEDLSAYLDEDGRVVNYVLTHEDAQAETYMGVRAPAQNIVGTSTVTSGIDEPTQRKSFYANGRFWVFWCDGSNLVYSTSTDGKAWATKTTIKSCSRGYRFSVFFDGTYVHYANTISTSNSAMTYRRGTPDADGGITWSAAEQTAVAGVTSITYADPMIAVDSSGYALIAYKRTDSGGPTTYPWMTKSGNNDGTWGSTPSPFPYQLDSGVSGASWNYIIVPLLSTNFYVLYTRSHMLVQGRLWTGSMGSPEDASSTNIADQGWAMSAVGDSSGDVHFVFNNETSNDLVYRFRDSSTGWDTEEILQAAVGSNETAPVLTIDGTTLYCFWAGSPTANHIYYKAYISGSWDADPTDFVDESTETLNKVQSISSYYASGGSYVVCVYMTLGSSPWNIRQKYIGESTRPITYERYIREHEAETNGNTGFGITVQTDANGVVELYCEDVSEAHFTLAGYFIPSEVEEITTITTTIISTESSATDSITIWTIILVIVDPLTTVTVTSITQSITSSTSTTTCATSVETSETTTSTCATSEETSQTTTTSCVTSEETSETTTTTCATSELTSETTTTSCATSEFTSETTTTICVTSDETSETTTTTCDTSVNTSETTTTTCDTSVDSSTSSTTTCASLTDLSTSSTTTCISLTALSTSSTTTCDTLVDSSTFSTTTCETSEETSETSTTTSTTLVETSETTTTTCITSENTSETTTTVCDTSIHSSTSSMTICDTSISSSTFSTTVCDTSVSTSETSTTTCTTSEDTSETTITSCSTSLETSDTTTTTSFTSSVTSETTTTSCTTSEVTSETTTTTCTSSTDISVSSTSITTSSTSTSVSSTSTTTSSTSTSVSSTATTTSTTSFETSETSTTICTTSEQTSETTTTICTTSEFTSETTMTTCETSEETSKTTTTICTTSELTSETTTTICETSESTSKTTSTTCDTSIYSSTFSSTTCDTSISTSETTSTTCATSELTSETTTTTCDTSVETSETTSTTCTTSTSESVSTACETVSTTSVFTSETTTTTCETNVNTSETTTTTCDTSTTISTSTACETTSITSIETSETTTTTCSTSEQTSETTTTTYITSEETSETTTTTCETSELTSETTTTSCSTSNVTSETTTTICFTSIETSETTTTTTATSIVSSTTTVTGGETLIFSPMEIITNYGVLDSGDIDSVIVYNDADSYNVSELGGAYPVLQIDFNFTNLPNIYDPELNIYLDYDGSLGHDFDVQIWNWTDSSWITIGGFSDGVGFQWENNTITNPISDIISGGMLLGRFDHTSPGNANHNLFIDYIELSGRVDAVSTITVSSTTSTSVTSCETLRSTTTMTTTDDTTTATLTLTLSSIETTVTETETTAYTTVEYATSGETIAGIIWAIIIVLMALALIYYALRR